MRRNGNATPLARAWTRRSFLATGCAAALAATGPRSRAASWPPTLGAPADVGYAEPDWLVDPDWLMDRHADPTVKVVALTPAEDFAAGHVPGARQLDWPALE